ncbi:lantibiotic dehydratase family protein [uncultured Nonlabens sp.]|uniref:lantibiotic dehydratase family protein n=1 Tax=uncultured Nonlabens sp. TaxID=859306 RepID=UPI0026196F91|nr:lantibiotic dehydratase family protein [uncultured Nonlabens sp.]
MTQKHKNSYDILDHFALRTPLLSLDFYKRVLNKEALSNNDFQNVLENSLLREGIYLASPELYAQILKWEKGFIKDPKKIERLQYAVLKYATRITTRCTPFGLFATCSAGSFTDETAVQLHHQQDYKRYTRFDTTFLTQLLQVIVKEANLRTQLLFYTNTSLYKINDHYRYIEYSIENKRRSYALEGIMQSDAIDLILKSAAKGASIKELATLLLDDEITLEEATEFIEELIENQLLLSELEITVTGNDYFTNLLDKLEQWPDCGALYNHLIQLQQALLKLDHAIGNDVEVYKKIIERAREFVPELDAKFLFQTDCFSTATENTLSHEIKQQLQKAFVLFNKLTLPTGDGRQEEFKKAFTKRFEDAEVPLHFALDTETGIGYGAKNQDTSSLLEDLALSNGGKKRYERIIWTDVDQVLQEKLLSAIADKDYTIELQEADFKEFPLDYKDLPDTLSAMVELYDQDRLFIKGAGGSSAMNLLGRFSYGDPQLEEHVKNIASIEATINKDKILAEIVHLPEARTGNILQRSHLREYEIPYIGYSSLHQEKQIPVDDIMISVRHGEIHLRSKKLNKEVLPRLGNAHNYSQSKVPMYQFLCEMQSQRERSWIGFQWNTLHLRQAFLPRVIFRNLIFSKARWNIKTADFKKLIVASNVFDEVQKWRASLQIPDVVELVEGDNKLLICLTNTTSLHMLLHTIKNKSQFILEEFLFSDKTLIKDVDGNPYCNQVVVAFYNKEKLDVINNDN